jgi:hypothetical protein
VRDFIINPGPTKLRRWAIALHESAHAAAYINLCGARKATVFLFAGGGGLCRYWGPRQNFCAEFVAAVCTAVGPITEACTGWTSCPPTIRPRGGRIPRSVRRQWAMTSSDDKFVAVAVRISELETKLRQPRRLEFTADDIQREAHLFLNNYHNASMILELAKRLYRSGKATLYPLPLYDSQPLTTADGVIAVNAD